MDIFFQNLPIKYNASGQKNTNDGLCYLSTLSHVTHLGLMGGIDTTDESVGDLQCHRELDWTTRLSLTVFGVK